MTSHFLPANSNTQAVQFHHEFLKGINILRKLFVNTSHESYMKLRPF